MLYDGWDSPYENEQERVFFRAIGNRDGEHVVGPYDGRELTSTKATVEYIAHMDPTVGLALADWLDRMALLIDCPVIEYLDKRGRPVFPDHRVVDPAVALARAILREDG